MGEDLIQLHRLVDVMLFEKISWVTYTREKLSGLLPFVK